MRDSCIVFGLNRIKKEDEIREKKEKRKKKREKRRKKKETLRKIGYVN
jgi:hypothetical protein